MREGIRFSQSTTKLAAFAALLLFGTQASAQEARTSYIERQGFRTYESTYGERPSLIAPDSSSLFVVDTRPQLNQLVLPRATERVNTSSAEDEDVIVVTGQTQRSFNATPDPDFERNLFADMGVTTIQNPENEGLGQYMPLRSEQIEGWQGVRTEFDLPFGLELPDSVSLSVEGKRYPGVRIAVRY